MKLVKHTKQFKTKIDEKGRVCTKCGEYKLWKEFPLAKSKKIQTKRASSCKKCKLENRPARNIEREKYCQKKRNKELKETKPYLLKARLLRSRLLARFKDEHNKKLTPSTEILQKWLESQDLRCYYSQVMLQLDNITVDHKQPINRGGTNELSNLCIASHHMNTAKGSMNEQEFKSLLKLISSWEDKGFSLLRRLKQGHFG